MFFQRSHHHCLLLLLLSLVITLSSVSDLASGFHGNQQAQAHDKFQKLKYLRNRNGNDDKISTIDKSLFKAEEIDIEAHVYEQEGLKEKDRIDKLPGQPLARFSHYGGYVTISKKEGRAFYYYFTEAVGNKQNLPLVLWLNGGPGCSSLAYGAMQELGPFRVNSDGKTLFKNRYSWNHVANVLFLESPSGVGFSYSNITADDEYGDTRTASNNYIFLLNWLERFPEYKNRDFYITGESYAGHYIPQLAQTILQHNIKAHRTIINLKGILVGNPAINDETDNKGMYDFLGSHAISSELTYSKIEKFCDFSPNVTYQSDECNEALDESDMNSDVIDIYNIYAPLCNNHNLTSTPKPTTLVIDECNENYVVAYLNRGDVQEALHANVTKMNYEWSPCSYISLFWMDSPYTTLPLFRQIMDQGIRVWIFSGDVDGRVPITSTLSSLNTMHMKVNTPWHPWYFNGQVAGYTQVYKGDLTYATVRGAGHQVPSYEAARSLSLFKHFLDGTPLPDTTRY